MDFITPLNITMFAVITGLFIITRPIFFYRNMLKDALTFTLEPIVKQNITDRSKHVSNYEKATEDYMWYSSLWIPLFYITILFVALLWLGFSYGVSAERFALIVALAVSALATRAFMYDHCPAWLMDWTVEMMTLLRTAEAVKLKERMKVLEARSDELVEKAETEVGLTEAEEVEMFKLLIESRELHIRAKYLNAVSADTDQYINDRKNMPNQE